MINRGSTVDQRETVKGGQVIDFPGAGRGTRTPDPLITKKTEAVRNQRELTRDGLIFWRDLFQHMVACIIILALSVGIAGVILYLDVAVGVGR